MPAAKGHPRWGGRRKGTPNKVTADFRDLVRDDTKDFSVLRRLAIIDSPSVFSASMIPSEQKIT